MEVWIGNFFWIGTGLAWVAWLVAGLLWRSNLTIAGNLVQTSLFSCIALSSTATIAAALSHFVALGADQVASAFLSDLRGGFAYFLEVGLEATVLWFPVLLLRVGFLTVRELWR